MEEKQDRGMTILRTVDSIIVGVVFIGTMGAVALGKIAFWWIILPIALMLAGYMVEQAYAARKRRD